MTITRLTVQAGHHDRRYCPAEAILTVPADPSGGGLGLYDMANGRYVPHQSSALNGKLRIRWIIDDLPAERERQYELRRLASPLPAGEEGVRVEDLGGTLRFAVGGSDFTTYNYGAEVVRPYFYPLQAAPGVGITRNWPMVLDAKNETDDHPHHKGLYTAQGAVNGVDNWGEGEGHGYQVHSEFERIFEGSVAGGFIERLVWTDKDKKPNLAEERSVAVSNTPAGLRIIDYEVSLIAEFGDVTLGDTKEGGLLSIRVAPTMDGLRSDGGTILNGFGGVGEAETWGKRAPWCDYSGPVQGDWCGICMMDHPSNPRHPTYWHVRDYGLMTANCFGVHDFTADPKNTQDLLISAGDSLTWRYRALVHAGRGEFGQLTRSYHDFANPPTVVLD
jgi:hypothetical protein